MGLPGNRRKRNGGGVLRPVRPGNPTAWNAGRQTGTAALRAANGTTGSQALCSLLL